MISGSCLIEKKKRTNAEKRSTYDDRLVRRRRRTETEKGNTQAKTKKVVSRVALLLCKGRKKIDATMLPSIVVARGLL